MPAMVDCRSGPKWTSTRLAQEAQDGVKDSSTRLSHHPPAV
ncbi:hypothetical protein ACIQ9I_26350 [Streptomyces sp. NPDC094461]